MTLRHGRPLDELAEIANRLFDDLCDKQKLNPSECTIVTGILLGVVMANCAKCDSVETILGEQRKLSKMIYEATLAQAERRIATVQ